MYYFIEAQGYFKFENISIINILKLLKVSRIYGLLYETGLLTRAKEGARNLIRNTLYKLEQKKEQHGIIF